MLNPIKLPVSVGNTSTMRETCTPEELPFKSLWSVLMSSISVDRLSLEMFICVDLSCRRTLFHTECNLSTAVVLHSDARQTWQLRPQQIHSVVPQVHLDKLYEASPDVRTSTPRLTWQPEARYPSCQTCGNLRPKCWMSGEIRNFQTYNWMTLNTHVR